MDQRLQFQTLLEAIMAGTEDDPGVENPEDHVHFQATSNIQLEYPCILYNLDDAFAQFGDNIPYRHHKRYEVTVIDRNPDSKIPDKIRDLPMSSFSRFFVADNLNHFVFNVFL